MELHHQMFMGFLPINITKSFRLARTKELIIQSNTSDLYMKHTCFNPKMAEQVGFEPTHAVKHLLP